MFLVLARRAALVPGEHLAGWLTLTARRVVANQRRVTSRRRRHEREAAVEHARQRDCGAPEPAWDDARQHLDAALASLSAGRREAVLRFHVEGKPQAVVAAELGCSTDAVKTRVNEGLTCLRAFFARRGVALGAVALASGLASEAGAHEPAIAASCAHAVFNPDTAPGAAAFAAGKTTMGTLKAIALAISALLLISTGGLVLWQHGPASIPPQPLPVLSAAHPLTQAAAAKTTSILLSEDFEVANFRSHGWYDNPDFIRSASGRAHAGLHAAEFAFQSGQPIPRSGGPSRRLFRATESIHIDYWMLYSPDWDRSASLIQLLLLLTSEDGRYAVPSDSKLACGLGVFRGSPFVSFQEVAANAGEGGTLAGQRPTKRHTISSSAIPLGRWHHVEVRLLLNRIIAGKAVADGQLSYRLDGEMLLERADVVFRTADHPDMRFNQLIVGPWANESPREQTMWIDDLTLTTDEPSIPAALKEQP